MKKLLMNKYFNLVIYVTFSVSVLLTVVIIVLEHFDYYLLNSAPSYICYYLSLSFAFIIFLSLSFRRNYKKLIHYLLLFAFIGVFLISAYLSIFMSFGKNKNYYFISPDGKNKIVVFEGGFIDTYYTAYPVKYQFFYKYNNKESASRNDFWGCAKLEIEWELDSATVYIIFDEKTGRNSNDIITVNYA